MSSETLVTALQSEAGHKSTSRSPIPQVTKPKAPQQADVDFEISSEGDGATFATMRQLQNAIGPRLFRVLPALDSLDFPHQDDKDYLPICLRIGAYADDHTGILRRLYLYLKRSTNTGAAPGICIVISNIIADENKEKIKKGKRNEGKQIPFERLLAGLQAGHVHLIWPLRQLEKPEEFKAVAKCCFILAAESRTYGFKKHYIPQNNSFENQLRKACERISAAIENDADMSSDHQTLETLSRFSKGLQGTPQRKTAVSSNATKHAEETGLSHLDVLPAGFLQSIDKTAGGRAVSGVVLSRKLTIPPAENPQNNEGSPGNIVDTDRLTNVQPAESDSDSDIIHHNRRIPDHAAKSDSGPPLPPKTRVIRGRIFPFLRFRGSVSRDKPRPKSIPQKPTSTMPDSKARKRELKTRADLLKSQKRVLNRSIARKQKQLKEIDEKLHGILEEALSAVSTEDSE